MMNTRSRLLLALLLSTTALLHAEDAPAPKGPIVCLGDSITKAGFPEVLAKLLGVDVVNAGVGGQLSGKGLARLQKDVLDRKPSTVVILFGTNDSRLAEPAVHVPVAKYQKNLEEMAERCQSAGAKVVICTLPPINEKAYFERHAREPFDKAGGMAKVLEEYRAAAMRAAQTRHAELVDLNQLLLNADWMKDDGVHPNEKGNEVIAELISKALGFKK